jgi:hypothetical protein
MMDDNAGPTAERLHRAQGCFTIAGRSRSSRRISMLDDSLGRAWMRRWISDEECAGLRRYALHWLAGGLCGPMPSVDLNRIYAHDPSAMSGLAKTEKQQDHREAYYAARCDMGRRPAAVADHVALYDFPLREVGFMLGYRSAAHAREAARELLSEAGHRLFRFWKDRDR